MKSTITQSSFIQSYKISVPFFLSPDIEPLSCRIFIDVMCVCREGGCFDVIVFCNAIFSKSELKHKQNDRAHRLYDAAILTRCYTQHALRPYIDSEINHIRHFIKIQFVNKGIEFINLPSVFKDKSVISSIPTYFENKESPIIFVVLFLTITN